MYMYMFVCICICLYVYVYVCMYMYMFVCICICLYVYVYVCMYMYMFVCMCIYITYMCTEGNSHLSPAETPPVSPPAHWPTPRLWRRCSPLPHQQHPQLETGRAEGIPKSWGYPKWLVYEGKSMKMWMVDSGKIHDNWMIMG